MGSMVAGLAGSAVGIIADIPQQFIQYDQARYNAEMAWKNAEQQQSMMNYNARVEEMNANTAQQEARYAESRQRDENRHVLAAQRASIGASGATASGSPLTVLAESAENLEMSALDIRRRGEVERDQHLYAADLYRYQGNVLAAQNNAIGDQYGWQASYIKNRGVMAATGVVPSDAAMGQSGNITNTVMSSQSVSSAQNTAALSGASTSNIRNSDYAYMNTKSAYRSSYSGSSAGSSLMIG